MSLEVIDVIIQAEEAALSRKADAIAEAKRTVAAAEEEGRTALVELERKISAELKKKSELAYARAKVEVDAIEQEAEFEKDKLRKKAEERFDKLSEYIVERIVNG